MSHELTLDNIFQNRYWPFILIAILCHFFIFALFYSFTFYQKTNSPKNSALIYSKQEHMINAYILQTKVQPHPSSNKNIPKQINQNNPTTSEITYPQNFATQKHEFKLNSNQGAYLSSNKTQRKKVTKQKSYTKSTATRAQTTSAATSPQVIHSKLQALLHDDLQEHLLYPASAQDMQIQGTVTVGFTVLPQGTITDIKIIHSSGDTILNSAAKNTVKWISPFLPAKKHLQHPSAFVVNIVFSLYSRHNNGSLF